MTQMLVEMPRRRLGVGEFASLLWAALEPSTWLRRAWVRLTPWVCRDEACSCLTGVLPCRVLGPNEARHILEHRRGQRLYQCDHDPYCISPRDCEIARMVARDERMQAILLDAIKAGVCADGHPAAGDNDPDMPVFEDPVDGTRRDDEVMIACQARMRAAGCGCAPACLTPRQCRARTELRHATSVTRD